jgi:hypothetical protein
VTDFRYDALGRKFKNVQKNAQGQVTGDKRFVYDGLDLIADLNSSDQVVASYTNGLGIDDPLVMRDQKWTKQLAQNPNPRVRRGARRRGI